MKDARTTIQRFIIEEQRKAPGATGELSTLLNDLVSAFKAIAAAVGRAGIAGVPGGAAGDGRQGERQKKLAAIANEILLRSCEWGGQLAAMASGEMEGIHQVPGHYPRGKYLLVLDPLDGAPNLDVNVSVGTILSVLRAAGPDPTVADFLQPGTRQVCAGYAIYGPAAMVVLTLGQGVHGFTLDREVGEFVLTHPGMRIPEEAREFAVNASNQRFWEMPVKRYVSECLAGKSGPRGSDFNMRWIASLVAEVHRILVRGGLFMYPRDTREPPRPGRLRLLHAANPMAMIVEAAGGAASTGRERLLEVQPGEIHQRVPVILGSKGEVERLVRYHREHELGLDRPYTSPLFGSRTLFME